MLPGLLKSTSETAERAVDVSVRLLESWRFVILLFLSAMYLWTTAFEAQRKLHWFDEILTIELSQNVSLSGIWTALMHGADFNPPLLYLLTGFSERVFGNTSLANRMPEIVAVWVFCLCLYWFTFRFAGAPGALIAFLFPLVTIAQWYAYEARPHALVLGFAGLAAVCWQRAQTSNHRPWWLIGLGLSLGLVLLSHAFGLVVFFPIVLAEIVDWVVSKRFRPGAWIAMLGGGSAILVSFVLLRAMNAVHAGLAPKRPGFALIDATYLFLLGPAVMALGLAFCAVLLCHQKSPPDTDPAPQRTWRRGRSVGKVSPAEAALIAGFVLIPFISFGLAFAINAPLYTRYSLEAVFGFACLFGLAAARRPLIALALPAVMLFLYALSFSAFIHTASTQEPTTSTSISANYAEYAKRYSWMSDAHRTELPIVLTDDLHFAPIIYYAVPELQSRMIVVWKGAGVNARGYSRLLQYTKAAGRVMPLEAVVRTYPSFLLFETHAGIVQELPPTVQSITLLRRGDMQLLLVSKKLSTKQ